MPNNNNNITDEENERNIARLKVTLEAKGNVKLECPCNKCRGFNRRRLVRKTIERHCWINGHVEGGFTYRPMVSYLLLYIVFVLSVFIKFSFILIFVIYTNFIDCL
jgi:hypothetical protein